MGKTNEILIVGAGIFGLSSAIALAQRKYKVTILNPDTIPHHMAASTDISKVVRMAYGSDEDYTEMAEICIEKWKNWNDLFDQKLFFQVGFLLLCKHDLDHPSQSFERESFHALTSRGHSIELLDQKDIQNRFPAVNHLMYEAATFNPIAGYVHSSQVIRALAAYAKKLGVDIHCQTVKKIKINKGKVNGVTTIEGKVFHSDSIIIAAGAYTPFLVPGLLPNMRITGHPIFWLRLEDNHKFIPPALSVFGADISNTGWYGFPYNELGIIKLGKHSAGTVLHPVTDDRYVLPAEVEEMRNFLMMTFPDLSHAPLVYTRKCLYTDTLDGHFWIDHHPEIKGLMVSTGGSGHAMKMGPILGEITADVFENKPNKFSDKFKWRQLYEKTRNAEKARNTGQIPVK